MAGSALRSGLLGRALGGALKVAGPVGEVVALLDALRNLGRNATGSGAAALAALHGDRSAYVRARLRMEAEGGAGATAGRYGATAAELRAARSAPGAARPPGWTAPVAAQPSGATSPRSEAPPPRAPVQDLAAFSRAVSADAAAMLAHARALGALATAEIAAAGRIATAAGAPAPAAALASTGPRQGAPAAVRQVNNHFHIHGSSDPHATGRAAARAARAEEHRALHDGADG